MNSISSRIWNLRSAALVLALIVTIAGIARGADEPAKKSVDTSASAATPGQKPAADLLAMVAPYIGGEWRIEATWTAGNPLKARETFEWGIGKKFIVAKTYVSKEDGSEYQRYETIYGEKDGQLVSWGFTFDGHADELKWTIEGKKLSAAKPMKLQDGSMGTLHQSVELVEPNTFHWLVSIEANGKMQPLM